MAENWECANDWPETGPTVAEFGEQKTIAKIVACLQGATAAVAGPGDDCAVLRHRGDTVITSDTMVEGSDFRRDWHTPFALGWKLAATNLSDVVAMGARPTALTVAITCPGDTRVEALCEIARGLTVACEALAPGCAVVGGDIAAGQQMVCAVTAVGEMGERQPVLRSGAKPGDIVAYAGSLGRSGAGLARLYALATECKLSVAEAVKLWHEHPTDMRAHLMPSPPIGAGIAAAEAGASAMLDVSDGLAIDAARIAKASGVSLNLFSEQIMGLNEVSETKPEITKEVISGLLKEAADCEISTDDGATDRAFFLQKNQKNELDETAPTLDQRLHGGEDHGLLACFPQGQIASGFTPIGEVLATVPGVPLLLDGKPHTPRGWDSIASSSKN
ncbi:MAG: thiamine-phosphate kinase [Microbacteriaceae bacterium]|nr:thiamine-phosphate kinase [Microbacteriaceae bacterium]